MGVDALAHGKILLLATLTGACTCVPPHSMAAAVRAPALPVARGDAGPFASATVTTVRTPGMPDGTFAVELRTATGLRMVLPGPDEPTEFFLLDPKAVLLVPIDRSGRNGVVVLYNSSRLGPGHGTDCRVLVYRVNATTATRLTKLEARLTGIATAQAARIRLAQALAQ